MIRQVRSALRMENITIGYKSVKKEDYVVARNLSLELYNGEVVCLIGPNGAGKSTLIRSITGLQDLLSGRVYLSDKEITQFEPKDLAKHVSIVTTERVNLGMFTGYSLAALGRYPYTDWRGTLSEQDKHIVLKAIESVGARKLSSRSVREMSDGERQKIMIARALAQEADVMVLDEPTAFLDLPRRVEVMSLLHKLSRETETAVLISTHDLDLALRTADRLWLISQKGSLTSGAPEDCILTGAFEETFSSDSVQFDSYHGSFHMNTRKDITLGFQGTGLHGYWTQRALEREGFKIVKNNPSDKCINRPVTVSSVEDPLHWKVFDAEKTKEFDTIYSLITYLRSIYHGK